jgi:hypothetical protein
MLSPEEQIKRAKITRYEHGGGRMYYEDGAHRHLIADFYDEATREYILGLLGHASVPQNKLEQS